MQDLDQTLLLRSITRYARAVRESALVLSELDEARRACPEIPVFVAFCGYRQQAQEVLSSREGARSDGPGE